MWVSTRTAMAGTASMRARRPVIRRDSQSTTVSPTTSAPKWATCVDQIGQITPLRRPSGMALPGEIKEAQEDRGQNDHEEAHLATQDREVSPSPPWGEKPQHGEEGDEPEAPVGSAQPDQSDAHHQ